MGARPDGVTGTWTTDARWSATPKGTPSHQEAGSKGDVGNTPEAGVEATAGTCLGSCRCTLTRDLRGDQRQVVHPDPEGFDARELHIPEAPGLGPLRADRG